MRAVVFAAVAAIVALGGCAMTPEERAANQAQGQADLAAMLGIMGGIAAVRAQQPAQPSILLTEPARRQSVQTNCWQIGNSVQCASQ